MLNLMTTDDLIHHAHIVATTPLELHLVRALEKIDEDVCGTAEERDDAIKERDEAREARDAALERCGVILDERDKALDELHDAREERDEAKAEFVEYLAA
jgi:hypothetical protein